MVVHEPWCDTQAQREPEADPARTPRCDCRLPATERRTCCCKAGDPCDYHAATCTTCGDGGCKGHPLPATEKPEEARPRCVASPDWSRPYKYIGPGWRAQVGVLEWTLEEILGSRLVEALDAVFPPSPPPQAQPEAALALPLMIDGRTIKDARGVKLALIAGGPEAEGSDGTDEPGQRRALELVRLANGAPAQPEETPKRIGGDEAKARLSLAREALLRDGYFTPEQVDDDVAPRIIERLAAAEVEVERLRALVAECEAEHPPEQPYLDWCAAGKPDVASLRLHNQELELRGRAVVDWATDKDGLCCFCGGDLDYSASGHDSGCPVDALRSALQPPSEETK